jgi:hypothetical protein
MLKTLPQKISILKGRTRNAQAVAVDWRVEGMKMKNYLPIYFIAAFYMGDE